MILSDWLEADHSRGDGGHGGTGRYSAREFLITAALGLSHGNFRGLFRPEVIRRRCTWTTAEGLPCRLLGAQQPPSDSPVR